MPKQYQPTGRPPGRPKTTDVTTKNVKDVRARFKDPTQDPAHMPLDAICPDCFPDGWTWTTTTPGQALTAACHHGTWVKRL